MKYICWLIFAVGLGYSQSSMPIKVTLTDAANGGTKVVIENDSTSALTAVAISSPGEPFPHLMDSAIQQWHATDPGKSANIGFGNPRPTPPLEFRAAILADGRTFGDPAMIQALLAKRRATLQALAIMLQHFPVAGATPPGPLIPVFRSYKEQQLNGLAVSDPVRTAVINANGWMERQMQMMAGETPEAIITATTALLRDWQTALSHSLPSLQ